MTTMEAPARRAARGVAVSPGSAVLLAVSLGLCAGYLDLVFMILGKYFWNSVRYIQSARDFPWTVPAGHAVLLLIVSLVIAAVNCRPSRRQVSLRFATWLFATLAIWAALLRAPISGACAFVLAAGLGRLLADVVSARGLDQRRLRFVAASLVGVLVVLAALSTGWQTVRERRAVAGLPPASSGARNVLLIVWDTVRAYNISSYGYYHDTTPSLTQWASKGVQYKHATSPAPWTFPSHSSFFTGQWPFKLNSQWNFQLDTQHATLAEYLASRGYQTAGFVANTRCCSYESGLARGFDHFDDYSLSPSSLLSRTVPGKWILENVLTLGGYLDVRLGAYYDKKWVTLQSRGATEINETFCNWLDRRRPDRPFFAFLNYFDAHEPFVPPLGYESRFGRRPETLQDYEFLFDYVGAPKASTGNRKLQMARACYDDCISFLDEQLGRLLVRLQNQGLLENTDVIITSDHGEAFGDHFIVGHSYSVNLDEIGVPLVILSPRAGRHAGAEPGYAARLASHHRRPARARGRFTVPGAVAGVVLESARARANSTGNHHARFLGTGRLHGASTEPARRPWPRRLPDVPRGPGPSLHPRRQGRRAAL